MGQYRVIDQSVHEFPISVIDFETTGLTPGIDRVIEASVVRIEPGLEPILTFDSLINPKRPVSATEIHGIEDKDVVDAPAFDEVAADFVEAVSGTVIAAYNVYFDIKFLDYELSRIGITSQVPYFCLMYMRPMLGLGKRCNLEKACNQHNVQYSNAHMASADAMASAKLMKQYLKVMAKNNIATFKQLSALKNYKFIDSFTNQPLPSASTLNIKTTKGVKSRTAAYTKPVEILQQSISKPIKEYWDTLCTVLADLEITDEELEQIINIRLGANMPREEVRMLHAKAFASVIHRFIDDKWLDDKEASKLKRLHQCLSKLGWAPGE